MLTIQGPQEHDQAIQRELVSLLFDGLPRSQAAAVIVALMVFAMFRGLAPLPILLGWMVSMLAVTLARLEHRRRFRALDEADFDPGPWRRGFLLGVLLSSISWGLGIWLLFPQDSLAHQAFLAIVVAGLTAGALPSLAASLEGLAMFVLLLLLPLSLRLAGSGETVHIANAVLALVYGALILSLGRTLRQQLWDSSLLRHRAEVHEKALLQSEDKYRQLFEGSEDPTWLVISQRIAMSNQSGAHALGFSSSDEIVGYDPVRFGVGSEIEGGASSLRQMFQIALESGMCRDQVSLLNLRGERMRADLRMNRIRFGDEIAILCHWQDLSGQGPGDEPSADPIPGFMATRAGQLECQLEATKRLLPNLQEIAMLTSRALQQDDGMRMSSALVDIQRSVDETLEEFDHFLTQGHSQMQDTEALQRFAVAPMLERVIARHADAARAAELKLVLNCRPGIPESLVSNERQIEQVLNRLIGNAIRFSERGRVELIVERVYHRDDPQVRFIVDDQGPGISPSRRREILFTHQPAPASEDAEAASLASCRALVERLGGELQIRSTLGLGSSFSFSLPLRTL